MPALVGTRIGDGREMQQDDALHKRGRSLEEVFFQKKDTELLEKMRQKRLQEITKEEIAAATGIRDEQLLDRLISMEINLQTLTALSVIPLVEIAWADGRVEKKERDAVLQAADEAGIPEEGPGHRLLEEWLTTPPDAEMLGCWKDYVAALADTLDAKEYALVRDNLLARARKVAEASGGILGLGSVSEAENKKLSELEAAFRK